MTVRNLSDLTAMKYSRVPYSAQPRDDGAESLDWLILRHLSAGCRASDEHHDDPELSPEGGIFSGPAPEVPCRFPIPASCPRGRFSGKSVSRKWAGRIYQIDVGALNLR